ncbi:MAG: carbamoyltransferase family protein [Planctomycetota bacterium]
MLGLNTWDHDVAACLLRNGSIEVAVAKERITRRKHADGFHGEVIDYCLEAAGIQLDDIDLIVNNCYLLPVEEMERRLLSTGLDGRLVPAERLKALKSPVFLERFRNRVSISHHLAHAYSAFAASPFERGAVMVVDGVGSYRSDVTEDIDELDDSSDLARESESYYVFEGERITPVAKVFMEPARGFLSQDFNTMPGIGALYSRVSEYVLGHWNKCGEIMGLAPYGKSDVPSLIRFDGEHLEVPPWIGGFDHPFVGNDDEDWEKSPFREEWAAMAHRVQEDTERVLIARARRLHEVTGEKDLCMAGGVALNCVANGRLLDETPFERIWIQPAAGDDGVAIGCALYGHLQMRGHKRSFVMTSPHLGKTYSADDIQDSVDSPAVHLAAKVHRPEDLVAHVAGLLADGNVVGWFQGGSEFGPRALGHRSILADPREESMKDHVNARVKHRQGFRPFAPAVLEERAGEVFENPVPSPFMLLVRTVRKDMRDRVAAITHVDGTARVQTVNANDDPLFHALISAFADRTGIPVLLNTSFNLRGEPIVETPGDAVDSFLATKLDALVLHDTVLEKGGLRDLAEPVIRHGIKARRKIEDHLRGDG